MRKVWWFIILALFIQEPASTDAAIFQARSLHLNLFVINLIWLIATVIDIWLGYKIGKWIQKKFQGTKLVTKSLLWATRFENFIGRKGENFALIFIGVINFPYLNTFIGSWLKVPFKKLFLLIFIGDAIYWSIEWAINIGVRSFITNTTTALYVVIGLGLLFAIFSKSILNKVLKR
jgi:membrane protein YqaA with SNARE-associated domain